MKKQIDSYKPGHKRSVKPLLIAVCVLVIACTAISGSLAWLISGPQQVVNTFEAGNAAIEIVETFEDNKKSDVKVTNIGNVPVYIRVALIPAWVDDNGNIAAKPASLSDCTITWGEEGSGTEDAPGSGWFKGSDGFYYCETAVAPGSLTPILIKECRVNDIPQEFDFELQVIASAVQSRPTSTVEDVWIAVRVSDNGELVSNAQGGN